MSIKLKTLLYNCNIVSYHHQFYNAFHIPNHIITNFIPAHMLHLRICFSTGRLVIHFRWHFRHRFCSLCLLSYGTPQPPACLALLVTSIHQNC